MITIGNNLPKIGFGTWTIGGQSTADYLQDEKSINALQSAVTLGYRHFDTAEYYAAGHAEELLGQVVQQSGIARKDFFITSKVSPEHLTFTQVMNACEQSLKRLNMDYLDLYLVHWPKRGMDLEGTMKALNQLLQAGRIKNIGVSNFDLKLLIKTVKLSESPILTNQVSYSIPDRTYVKNGVLEYCQENGIVLTAYSPVKRRNIKSNIKLKSIALTHSITVQQAALAWLINQENVVTIPMSFNPQHQADNLAAAKINFSLAEMESLDYES